MSKTSSSGSSNSCSCVIEYIDSNRCPGFVAVAQSLLDNRIYQESFFTVIAPLLNYHVWDALALYQTHLRECVEGKVRISSFTLETLIETIRLCDEEHANALHHRYGDWWKIDREIEKHAPTFGLKKWTRKTTPEWP
jgi:hypothetical protein